MRYEKVPLENFKTVFEAQIELSSVALGAKVTSVSDQFFAAAHHLLLVEPAPSLKGQFGPNGALYSGWESRRHNPAYDWCIIKLGAPGSIAGFDVDTSHFNGNEAPEVSVEALFVEDGNTPEPLSDDKGWAQILSRVPLGPNSRHLFSITPSPTVNYVKLNMYPDGGIARFRVYGVVTPAFPQRSCEEFDLAHVFSGGRVVFTSDQHFGVGSNLIIPGRGKDTADGWETKRSREPGHKDWAIIKLGPEDGGYLSKVEIDTAHFRGNFPESCELYAISSPDLVPPHQQTASETSEGSPWAMILPRTKLKPDCRHFFQLQNVDRVKYTHVMLMIYPDGGVKRVRLIGARDIGAPSTSEALAPTTNALYTDDANPTSGEEALSDEVYRRFLANLVVQNSDPQAFCIPQRPYAQGSVIPPHAVLQYISFATTYGFDFPAEVALAGKCDSLVDGDTAVFAEQVQTINLRIEWPGYQGWGAQIRTVNYQEKPRSITRAKLLTEVAKQLEKFIENKRSTAIDPGHERYKVGPGGIELRHIHIASLEQVSRGSWQPRFNCHGP